MNNFYSRKKIRVCLKLHHMRLNICHSKDIKKKEYKLILEQNGD